MLCRRCSTIRRKPLEGIRVLDLSRILAGPYCTQILGDLGYIISLKDTQGRAEVIKVEHPIRGDDTRAWGPPFSSNGESAYYLSVNRNKYSVGVDFKTDLGKQIILDIAKKSDIFVENYVPGYGQTGPLSQKAGYDVMVEAEFGLMSITVLPLRQSVLISVKGHSDGPPAKVGVAITDLTAGLYTVNSILAALFHRTQMQEGQYIDVALSDCQVASLANIASSVLNGATSDRWGTAHASIVPYQSFHSSDGEIVIGCGNEVQFQKLLVILGLEDLAGDHRFSTNENRVKHRNALVTLLENVTKSKSTSEWEILLEKSGIPHAAIKYGHIPFQTESSDVKTALEHPHSIARNMVQDYGSKDIGEMKLVEHPIKYSTLDVGIKKRPPLLGEDTSDVLSRILGLNEEEIARLKHKGVIK